MKGNLLLLLVASAIAVFVAEGALQIRDRMFAEGLPVALVQERCPGSARVDHRCIAAIKADVPFDARSAFQVFSEAAQRGDTIWPAVPATLFRPDGGLEVSGTQGTQTVAPLSGLSQVPTLLCNESGAWVTYQSDEHGLNNPLGIHGSDSLDVVVVGDSFVHGWCVPREQSISGLLTSEMGPVLNLGFEGSGPLAQLGLLREYGRLHRPGLVLWFFFGENDPADLARDLRNPVLSAYLDPSYSQGLVSLREEMDSGLRSVIQERREEEQARLRRRGRRLDNERMGEGNQGISWLKLQRLRGLVRSARERRWQRDYPWDAESFRTVLARARDDVTNWGGRMVFVYLPSWRRFAHPDEASPHKDRILAEAEGLGLTTVDPTAAFSSHSDPTSLFPFGVDGHYTAEGFRILVDEVLTALGR